MIEGGTSMVEQVRLLTDSPLLIGNLYLSRHPEYLRKHRYDITGAGVNTPFNDGGTSMVEHARQLTDKPWLRGNLYLFLCTQSTY